MEKWSSWLEWNGGTTFYVIVSSWWCYSFVEEIWKVAYPSHFWISYPHVCVHIHVLSLFDKVEKNLNLVVCFEIFCITGTFDWTFFFPVPCIFWQPLASAYGLAKHRDGRWEWAIAPGVSPSPRYQHAAVSFLVYPDRSSLVIQGWFGCWTLICILKVFVNARLHVSGGALGGGRMVEDSSSVAGTLLWYLQTLNPGSSRNVFMCYAGACMKLRPCNITQLTGGPWVVEPWLILVLACFFF